MLLKRLHLIKREEEQKEQEKHRTQLNRPFANIGKSEPQSGLDSLKNTEMDPSITANNKSAIGCVNSIKSSAAKNNVMDSTPPLLEKEVSTHTDCVDGCVNAKEMHKPVHSMSKFNSFVKPASEPQGKNGFLA